MPPDVSKADFDYLVFTARRFETLLRLFQKTTGHCPACLVDHIDRQIAREDARTQARADLDNDIVFHLPGTGQ